MSRLGPNQLSALGIKSLQDGSYCDGGNLWITVTGKSRIWSVRYKSPTTGKRREMGIGPMRDVPLAKARQLATEARVMLRDGVDPLERREGLQAERKRAAGLTFAAVAEQYIEEQKAGWRDPKRAAVWTSSLMRLAHPTIGAKGVNAVSTTDILAILRPIWATKTETADRVRSRIERVLDYAQTHGWRSGENPARWKGHLANALPRASTVSQEQHRAAVPYQQIAGVMAALGQSQGFGALAVRFACLTAARSNEVRGATWGEIDMAARVWTIPAGRMKGGKREHRVPLSDAALAVVANLNGPGSKSDLVFPGGKPGRPLSDVALSKALHLAAGNKTVTVHGLRSTFRDWVAEETDYSRDVAEMALAHAIGDRVEAAYRRGDLFEKRREMMEMWGRRTKKTQGT